MITTAGIRSILPHRYPILLVDRVQELVPGERLTAVKAVTCNEPWYARLGPDATEEEFAYPETLLAESWAQAAGILASVGKPNPDVLAGQVMLAGSMSCIEFRRRIFPGDVLEHRVRVSRALSNTVIFDGESLVAGEVAFTVERMVAAFRPAEQLRPHRSSSVIGNTVIGNTVIGNTVIRNVKQEKSDDSKRFQGGAH